MGEKEKHGPSAVHAESTPMAVPVSLRQDGPESADSAAGADVPMLEDVKTPQGAPQLMKLEFEPNFGALRKKGSGANLSWENVQFHVKDRWILKGVSGKVNSTDLCALVGSSGAGKSSLMNILAGRVFSGKKKLVSGTLKVNGNVVNPADFRKNVAYVMQEDSLFATATTREALEFSAKLRLPASVSEEERNTIVNELIQSLGLSHVENTMCGSAMVRGLSGGEKKRVSIGIELVTNPSLLFLDEPTSGLDSFSAFQVVAILQALSRSGCAVLCTIHQPSSEIFSLFDKVIALAYGRVFYQGGVSTLPANLETCGFHMPALTNPADYLLLLAQTTEDDELPSFNEYEQGIANVESRPESNFGDGNNFDDTRAASKLVQMNLLAKREFLNLGRDKGALIGRFVITIFLNLLFGWIFFQAANPESSKFTVNSAFGALTNAFISSLFAASQPPLLTFPLERVVFLREYSTGTYSGFPYFVSKIMVEVPLYLFSSFLQLVILYWMVGFQGNFWVLGFEIFLVQLVSASYAFLIGALVNDVKQAQELAPLVFVPQLLFTGFFISIQQIPVSIRWVQYLCSLTYGLKLGIITEFQACANEGDPDCLKVINFNNANEDLVWMYVLILVAIFVTFRIGSLVALIWRAKSFSS